MTILKAQTQWPKKEIEEWVQRNARILNQVIDRNNSVASVTLTANAATTTVTIDIASNDNMPVFIPTTANAAAELATMYISDRSVGSFEITHANNAQTDRTFLYSLTG